MDKKERIFSSRIKLNPILVILYLLEYNPFNEKDYYFYNENIINLEPYNQDGDKIINIFKK